MSGMKGAQPTVPTGPSKNTPIPPYQVDDMEKFHRLATSGALSDLMLKLGGGKKK
jgi:hypothetical protein